ncbi:MAG: hypothetical protein AAGD25_06575 [Cyanobacteria bacterium P01_F01_bin.150]
MKNPTPTPTTLSPNSSAIASSILVDTLGCVAGVYYFARMLDGSGSGWATFSLEHAADSLGCAASTVRKNLSLALKRGCFYKVSVSGGVAVVRYRSDRKLRDHLGIDDLPPMFRLFAYELPIILSKATQASAERCQNTTIWLRRKSLRKQEKASMVTVEQIFQQESCMTRDYADLIGSSEFCGNPTPGGMGYPYMGALAEQAYFRSKRYLFVKPSFHSFGASQSRIGESLGRHRSTIARRLANTIKVQIAKDTGEGSVDWKECIREYQNEFDSEMVDYCKRRFSCSNKTFRPECNLYYLDIELVHQRRKLKPRKKQYKATNISSKLVKAA